MTEPVVAAKVPAKVTLEAGKDFDLVVLGISIGAFPGICPELIRAWEPLAKMVERIETVQTQAVQVWCDPTILTRIATASRAAVSVPGEPRV